MKRVEPLCPKCMTVQFSREADAWVRKHARESGISDSGLVRLAVDEYMKRSKR
ncbi:MAG: hypothetical protein LKG11_00815 [Bacilli bacterium]|jgi:hypothetical protein|nr:hypothetical protein [Bacilli bacterium]